MAFSLLQFISPRMAFNRAQYRHALYELEQSRRYELGGGGFNKYGAGHETSVNTELGATLHAMQSRARVAEQNSPYVKRALQVFADHVVGEGITPHVDGENSELKRIVEEFLLTNECDQSGQTNILGLQWQYAKARARCGEALLVRTDDPNSMLGFRIALLEADHLDHHKSRYVPNGNIMQGIEFSDRGRRIAYHMTTTHPGDNLPGSRKTIKVGAENVYHGFWADRPGQIRGVPLGHASLVSLGELEEYLRATVVGQKVAAAFGVIQEDATYKPAADGTKSILKKIIPGSIMRVRPGSKITTVSPPVTGHFLDYVITVLRAVAAGYGIPYELLTGDFSGVNYSSYRSRMLDFQKTIRRIQKFEFQAGFNATVNRWVYEAMGRLAMQRRKAKIVWAPQPVDIIDPTKEIPAKILEIRGGLDTLANALRVRGRNPEDVFAEIAKVNKDLDSYKILLDTDPRNKDRGGQHQEMKSTLEATDAKAA